MPTLEISDPESMPPVEAGDGASDELIENRHIASSEEDELGHEQIAAELADLVDRVEMPSNIALYGPWGSGKSGMANLLDEKLKLNGSKSRLVVFDAFKYAETPLRRHFISQLARDLGVKDEKFRKGLYSETVDTEITMPKGQMFKLLAAFALVLAAAVVVVTLAILGVAAVANGNTGDNFKEFLSAALPIATLPAALFLAFIALAGKTIPVNRKFAAPSSAEEFERLFKKLVKETRAKRLVVFIDELDRCSSAEVVATLETMRTFLGVPKCVFVVAADQQVLERALHESLRQATPADTRNPYYSTGSAYLDKTFHHQIVMPPLLPRRRTQFAVGLVSDRGGIWKQINLNEVIPVLIPTHVRSPRRVKVLLNTFAVSFRLAQRRAKAGALDTDLFARAAELAKLTCLNCEFPLFAADLERTARLPEYVLLSRRGKSLPEHLPEDVKALAKKYANGLLSVDELLIDEPGGSSANESQEIDPDDPEDIEAIQAKSPVRTARAQQLLAYLEKSEHVSGPSRELIFLESTGTMFGLDAAFAEQLEEFAVNGQRANVTSSVNALETDEERLAALRLLAQVTEDSLIGPEGRNCVSSLLAAASQLSELDFEPAAGELAHAVSSHMRDYELKSGDLAGALSLSMKAPVADSDEIIENVLARTSDLRADYELGELVLGFGAELLPTYKEAIASIVALRLSVNDDAIVEHLIALDDSTLGSLIDAMTNALASELTVTVEEEDPDV